MKKIALSKIDELKSAIEKDYELYVFEDRPSRSPKDVFFPQNENIASFRREENKIVIEPATLPEKNVVLFGIRACDEQSFRVLDNVFLSEPADTYYKARREGSIVITAACSKPTETCFCKTFGIDCAEPAGDIATWVVNNDMYFESKTEKGEAFMKKYDSFFEDLEEDDQYRLENVKFLARQAYDKLPLANLSVANWGGDKTEEKFNDPKWKELSDACIGCGTCTFVCPTCQCYDIRDYDTGNGIERSRCWDSCMYKDFTMCAHGTNRPTQMQRFRQRFMHKLVYYPANYGGMFSCVGCGRCVAKCPIHMNIAKVIKAFGGDSNE